MISEETLKYLRRMKEKKAIFRQSRLKSINLLQKRSRETAPASPAASHGTPVAIRPLVPSLQFSKLQEQTNLTLALVRYQRECKSQRTSVSPRHTSLSPCESPGDPLEAIQPRHTWDHFLTYHKESKRHSSNSTPLRVVNIHTASLRKAAGGPFLSSQLLRVHREVRVRTLMRRSPHHLFRIASQGGFFTQR